MMFPFLFSHTVKVVWKAMQVVAAVAMRLVVIMHQSQGKPQMTPVWLLLLVLTYPKNDFLSLHSLSFHKEAQLNAIIKEIVKYKGNTIQFTQRNKQPAFLVFCPSSRSTDRYSFEFSKKGGTIDSLLGAISSSAQCN
jgi:hypothetical protein